MAHVMLIAHEVLGGQPTSGPIMGLTAEQQRSFVRDGFVKLPGAVPPELVAAAKRAINTSLGHEGIDKEQIVTYQSQSWTPELRSSPAITDLFNRSSLMPTLRDALGGEPDVFPAATGGQIALRFPLGEDEVAAQLRQPEALRWGGHLDGLHTPTNGVPKGVLGTFTCLVGVALSEQRAEFAGNLGVLKGGHRINERFFQSQREAGDGSVGPGGAGWPLTDDGVPTDYIPPGLREELADAAGTVRGEDGKLHPLPTQLLMEPGDAVLVHFCTPHGNVPNLSPDTRYQIYFRVNHKDHHLRGGAGDGQILVDNWCEWPALKALNEKQEKGGQARL